MSQLSNAESLVAMKALLRDLENTNLIYPEDLSIYSLRQSLTNKITELESQNPARSEQVRAVATS
jgi:hypothetical protein